MAWSVQAGTGVSSAAASATVALPASVTSGDLLLLMVDLQSDGTATAPGYTEVFTDLIGADRYRLLTKTAGGSETAPTVTLGAAQSWCAMIVRVRGSDGAGPAQLNAQQSPTTTLSIDPPTAGSLKIGVVHLDPTTLGSVTWAGGVTGAGEIGNGSTSYVSVGYKEEDTAGAMTFTYSGVVQGTNIGTLIFSLAPGVVAGAGFLPQIAIT